MSSLLDPALLEGLSAEERAEALAAAAAAKRAEERAEARALERALQAKEEARRREKQLEAARQAQRSEQTMQTLLKRGPSSSNTPAVQFISKKQRQLQKEQNSGGTKPETKEETKPAVPLSSFSTTSTATTTITGSGNNNSSSAWTEKERQSIRQTYLGKTGTAAGWSETSTAKTQDDAKAKKKKRKGLGKKSMFRFEWDNTDDTLDEADFLYASANSKSSNRRETTNRPQQGGRRRKTRDVLDTYDQRSRKRGVFHSDPNTKPLDQMTPRDWRIFRENYEIVVKGGRAPPPLRNFREANLHPNLLQAIEHVLRYREPTPIQRQAIPIGLERRDLIGIAETGSGKTAAFGIPLLEYVLSLPNTILNKVKEDGPLALVVAPTRELALQIHGEFEKLTSRSSVLKAAAIVGGQSIQHQAQELREGVHVVVGTPGRINDCIEMAYLVLNQCCYIVLDEADRMIDMGFAPQMESILDAMGGLLKSENEEEAYKQEEIDRKRLMLGSSAKEDATSMEVDGLAALPKHRLTAMFSATMPMEVERMAKRYLRHPAVVSIGDQDSSKNTRIVQKIVFLSSPSQKERALRDLVLDRRFMRDKVIVFVNEKKHADGVGRMVERFGRPCVVLHGGKSQDQREENLALFRQGGYVLVATDVAGRGLDIPNVAHVINYNLPTRSIDSYSHRIGRTGRAGKQGLATSLLTDEDEGIMAPLKQYLESTGQPVPDKLARHRAASGAAGQGNLIY